MHLVVIHGWQEAGPELVQSLAAALGVTAFEVRPRLMGGGPSVVGRFADEQQAVRLAGTLRLSGVAAFVLDSDEARSRGRHVVRRFTLDSGTLAVETVGGETVRTPLGSVRLLLPAIGISVQTESVTVTERKLSLGKTILSGGIPMTKTVTRQEEVQTEERERMLFVVAADLPLLVFRQDGMSYDGFGPAMKLSRELNFSHLLAELRRLCPGARFDDRLLQRAGQVRVLGPAVDPDANLDLAAAILSRCLT
jgi:hypothetical protein